MTDRDDKRGMAQGFGQGYSYVAAGFTFAFAILLFGAAGWVLDGWIHTRPLFAVLAGLLGGFAAFMNLYFRVQRDIEKDREQKRNDKGVGSRES